MFVPNNCLPQYIRSSGALKGKQHKKKHLPGKERMIDRTGIGRVKKNKKGDKNIEFCLGLEQGP